MADQVATFKAVADFSRVNREADKTAKALSGVGTAAKGVSTDTATAMAQVSSAAEGAHTSLGSRLATGAGKAAKAMGVATAGAGALTGALAIKGGLTRLMDIEDAEAKLKGLGNSAKDVSAIMEDALSAVKGTAFGMGEAATTAASAVAAGIKPGKQLENYLKLTADAATIAGTSMADMGSIINKVTTSGKAMTDDLNQLADRGIPIFTWLQDEYDVSATKFREMVSKGEVDAKTFRKVIAENIGGAALESGKTTRGAFKNMMAALGRVGANLLSGIFPYFKKFFTGIQNLLAPMEEAATGWGKTLGRALGRVASAFANLSPKAQKVIGIISGVSLALLALWGVVAQFGSLRAASLLFGWVGALVAVGGALYLAYQRSETFRKAVARIWGAIKSLAGKMKPALSGALDALQPFFDAMLDAFDAFFTDLGDGLAVLVDAFGNVFGDLQAVFERLKPVIKVLVKLIGVSLVGAVRLAGQWFEGFAKIMEWVTSAPAWLKGLAAAILIVVGAMKAYAAISAIIKATNPFIAILVAIAVIVPLIVQNWDKIVGVVKAGWNKVKDITSAVWKGILGFFKRFWPVLLIAITGPIGAVVVAIVKNWDRIKKATKLLWSLMRPYFQAWAKFFRKTLGPVVQWLWKIVRGAFHKIGSLAKWLWNTAIKGAFNLIRQGIRGLGNMFKWLWNSVVKPVFGWIGGRAKWLWDKVIKPVFGLMQKAIRAYGAVYKWLWNNAVRPVLNWIGNAVRAVWDNFIKPAFMAMIKLIRGNVGGAFADLKDLAGKALGALKSGFRKVGDVFEWVWDHVLKPPLQAFKDMLDSIMDKVDAVKDAAGGIIGKGKDIVSGATGAVTGLIPHASGGYVTRPTAALVGEGGEAEAILPKSVLMALMAAAGRAGAAVSGAVSKVTGRGRGRAKSTTADTEAPIKKTGKVVSQTVNGKIVPALAKWDRTVDKRLAPSIDRLERKHATPTMNRIGRGMRRFVTGDLARLGKAWSKQFTQTAPDNYRTYRQRVSADTSRMVKAMGNGAARIKAIWSNLADSLASIWTNRIKPVLLAMGQFVRDSVAPIFRKGVEAVVGAWSKLKRALAKPVKFVIKVVINDGLVGSINKIAEYAGVDKMKPVPMPQGLATGGRPLDHPHGRIHGSGTERSDSIPARLSTNEHVWSAKEVRGAGGHRGVEELRARARANARRRLDKPTGRVGPHTGTPPHPQQFWLGGGTFPIPGYPVTNPHGTNYYSSWWAGDMAAPTGSKIVAWKKGTVAEVSQSGVSYGNETVINHPDGNWTRYAHQLKQFVNAGDQVSEGQRIGLSDSTGNVTGPHLHFEVGGGKADYKGGTGTGGAVPMLPPWAQKIASDTAKWAKGLLDAGLGTPWGKTIQGSLNTMAKPLAGWASKNLNKGLGAAQNFGPGAKGVWKSLMSTGFYSPQQAAGVMGNMQSESGFNPYIVQGGGIAKLPTGIQSGWGLVQWTPGTKVLPYLKGDGSIGSQVGALTAQLQGRGSSPEGAAGSALRRAKTPESAANIFGLQYERYAGPPQANRASQARAIYERFKGTHDQGGVLPHNGFALNKSGQDEYVLKGPEYRTWAQMLSAAERGRLGGIGRIGRLSGRVGTSAPIGKTVINAPVYTWHVHNPIPEKTSATTLKTLTAVAQRGLNR